VVPLAAWSFLVVVLYLIATFASVLLFPQWSNYEKLAFPLVALPMEMTQNPTRPWLARGFWGNWGMWIGFGVAVIIQAFAGLKFYYPQMPGFTLELPINIKEGPLQHMGWFVIILYPAVVGITVLMRTEVAFSVVGFFWFNRLQRVIGGLLGYRTTRLSIAGNPLWLGAQVWGGYFVYIGTALWTARHHLARAVDQLLGKKKPSPDEPIAYRTCLIGLLVCVVVATWWLTFAGMSIWSAAFTLGIYIMIILILSKVVAEVGLLFVQQTITPCQALNYFFGTNTVGARSLTVGMFFDRALSTDLRATVAPSFIQGLRIAEEGKINQRHMLVAFWVAILASLPVSCLSQLWIYYRYGAAGMDGWFVRASGTSGWHPLGVWISSPEPPNVNMLIWTGIGAGLVLFISALRQRYLWFWPHPVGFIMMQTHPVNFMWFSIFIGVLLKATILKYGGPRVMKQATPFFLGLALGDIFMMIVWRLVDVMLGAHHHFLLPG